MDTSKQPSNGNDYSVAKALNIEVLSMIALIVMADIVGLPEDHEINELNRAYILLVDEIQTLYDHNPKLAAIAPEPIWKHFDVLKTASWEINAFLEDPDNDLGQAHIARVDRLCILSGIDTPTFSENQHDVIDRSKKVVLMYSKIITDTNKNRLAKIENNWQIPEYKLDSKLDGTIWINNALKIKKANSGSTSERLLDQAKNKPNELFIPDLNSSRNLSTIISSAGFNNITRALFFPTVSREGIIFRPIVTAEEARLENIDTAELDLILKSLGAPTEPYNRS
jgi:hypothetical protein